MSSLREAAKAALAFTMRDFVSLRDFEAAKAVLHDNLRAALAQQEEPVTGIIESEIKVDSHQTIDEAMRLPRAMAQAYENGYKAGVAAEREACAQACEARFMGDMTREDMEARRCAAAIRARGEQP